MSRDWNTEGASIDWDGMKADAIGTIEIVRLGWAASEQGPPALHRQLVANVYGPLMEGLVTFLAAVEIMADESDDHPQG